MQDESTVLQANLRQFEQKMATNATWNVEERKAVKEHLRSAKIYLDKCKDSAVNQIDVLKKVRTELETEYVAAYKAVKDIITKRDSAWASILALGKKLEDQNVQGFCQDRNGLVNLYSDAIKTKPTFDAVFQNIARQTNGSISIGPLKHMFRALEKTVMKPADDNTLNRADNVCDVVRGMIAYGNFGDMAKGIQTTMDHPNVEHVRTKCRYSKPTSGGWMDLVINLRFKDDDNNHICEIQFVHEKLLMQRKGLGGHEAYNFFRSAMELLETHGKLETPQIVAARAKAAADAEAARKASAACTPIHLVTFLSDKQIDIDPTNANVIAALAELKVTNALGFASLEENDQEAFRTTWFAALSKKAKRRWKKYAFTKLQGIQDQVRFSLCKCVATKNNTVEDLLNAAWLPENDTVKLLSTAKKWMDKEEYFVTEKIDVNEGLQEVEAEEVEEFIQAMVDASGGSCGMRWHAKTIIEAPLVYKTPNKKIEDEQMRVLDAWGTPVEPTEPEMETPGYKYSVPSVPTLPEPLKEDAADWQKKSFQEETERYPKELKKYNQKVKEHEEETKRLKKQHEENMEEYEKEKKSYMAALVQFEKDLVTLVQREDFVASDGKDAVQGFKDAMEKVAGTIAIMNKYLGSVKIQAAAIRNLSSLSGESEDSSGMSRMNYDFFPGRS